MFFLSPDSVQSVGSMLERQPDPFANRCLPLNLAHLYNTCVCLVLRACHRKGSPGVDNDVAVQASALDFIASDDVHLLAGIGLLGPESAQASQSLLRGHADPGALAGPVDLGTLQLPRCRFSGQGHLDRDVGLDANLRWVCELVAPDLAALDRVDVLARLRLLSPQPIQACERISLRHAHPHSSITLPMDVIVLQLTLGSSIRQGRDDGSVPRDAHIGNMIIGTAVEFSPADCENVLTWIGLLCVDAGQGHHCIVL
mmetsp:Transcript_13415/g.47317  ORF Transcript_13415/g.47317 Transcript_13415/m.47317 type:complete len:256 (-) Transcript_13415:550-1317(-)